MVDGREVDCGPELVDACEVELLTHYKNFTIDREVTST